MAVKTVGTHGGDFPFGKCVSFSTITLDDLIARIGHAPDMTS
jgi:hypothetical protein